MQTNFGSISTANKVQAKSLMMHAEEGTRYAGMNQARQQKYVLGNRAVEGKGFRNAAKRLYAAQRKAITTTTGGPGSTDQTLVPIYLDDQIVDENRRNTPLMELVPRVVNQGLTADFNTVSSKPTTEFGGEDPALSESESNYERKSKAIKYLRTVFRVTGPAMESIPGFTYQDASISGDGLGGVSAEQQRAANAMQGEILQANRSHMEFMEDKFLNGDSSSDSNEWDGIIAQQGTTNEIAYSSGTDILKFVEQAAEAAFEDGGRTQLIVGSAGAVRQMREEAYDKGSMVYRGVELRDQGILPFNIPSAFGLDLMSGSGIPVIPSQFLDNTNGSKQVWLLDLDVIELRTLLDTTMERLAKTSDSEKAFLKTYATVINRVPERSAFVSGISDA